MICPALAAWLIQHNPDTHVPVRDDRSSDPNRADSHTGSEHDHAVQQLYTQHLAHASH